jgi:hypothetical protein
MKVSDTPERWVLLKILVEDTVYYKVFGSWSGTYLTGDRWKLNSGIYSLEHDEDYYYFLGYSGSCYKCSKTSYGIRDPYCVGILNTIVKNNKNKAEIVKEEDLTDVINSLIW